jgi:hypothetical protein
LPFGTIQQPLLQHASALPGASALLQLLVRQPPPLPTLEGALADRHFGTIVARSSARLRVAASPRAAMAAQAQPIVVKEFINVRAAAACRRRAFRL